TAMSVILERRDQRKKVRNRTKRTDTVIHTSDQRSQYERHEEKIAVKKAKEIVVPDNPVSRYLFSSTQSAWLWLIIRLYVGYAWLTAGWKKVTADEWTGEQAGAAVQGFVRGALEKEDVSSWYAAFLENVVLSSPKVFSFMVAYGELFVGLGLILGLFTGIAAFFGGFMNVSFLFAGTLSTNPLLFVLAT